jgi:cell division transport system ATP-binding protein
VSVSHQVLQFFQVYRQYAGDIPALSDVTFTVEQGEFVFISGASGAGKSTLLRLIFCGDTATSGQLLVFGRNVARIKPSQIPRLRRDIGVVFQDFKLLADRTVAENVAFPLEVRGLRAGEVRRRVDAILRSVGLDGKGRKFPASLSGGEQQRVAVARALVGEPRLLLADEPTGNLDPERTAEVMGLLQAAHGRGTTVVVATHDRALIARQQRRVIVLEQGRVVSGRTWPEKAVVG